MTRLLRVSSGNDASLSDFQGGFGRTFEPNGFTCLRVKVCEDSSHCRQRSVQRQDLTSTATAKPIECRLSRSENDMIAGTLRGEAVVVDSPGSPQLHFGGLYTNGCRWVCNPLTNARGCPAGFQGIDLIFCDSRGVTDERDTAELVICERKPPRVVALPANMNGPSGGDVRRA